MTSRNQTLHKIKSMKRKMVCQNRHYRRDKGEGGDSAPYLLGRHLEKVIAPEAVHDLLSVAEGVMVKRMGYALPMDVQRSILKDCDVGTILSILWGYSWFRDILVQKIILKRKVLRQEEKIAYGNEIRMDHFRLHDQWRATASREALIDWAIQKCSEHSIFSRATANEESWLPGGFNADLARQHLLQDGKVKSTSTDFMTYQPGVEYSWYGGYRSCHRSESWSMDIRYKEEISVEKAAQRIFKMFLKHHHRALHQNGSIASDRYILLYLLSKATSSIRYGRCELSMTNEVQYDVTFLSFMIGDQEVEIEYSQHDFPFSCTLPEAST